MRICAAQTNPIKGDIDKNIQNHLKLIKLACNYKADIVVFPELSITGYEPGLAKKLATTSIDKRFDVFQVESDKNDIAIALGCPVINNNNLCIGMIIFQPRKDRTTYLKKYLYHTEQEYFKSGLSLTNLNLKNNNLGLAICYELSVAEHQKIAFENGAEIYIASVVETIEGIEKSLDKMSTTSKKYSKISLMSNSIGFSGNYNCAGRSSIWDSDGKILGQMDASSQGILLFDTSSKELINKHLI